MGLEYVNRRGHRYIAFECRTKTGKPKYFCSRKVSADGTRLEQLPDGYEFYERLDTGIVVLRKQQPTPLLATEREQIVQWAKELTTTPVLIDVDEEHFVIYSVDQSSDRDRQAMKKIVGAFFTDDMFNDHITHHNHYTAMFRFSLEDIAKRTFTVERWCFKGSMEGWIHLKSHLSLQKAAKTYLPHIGEESFFELW